MVVGGKFPQLVINGLDTGDQSLKKYFLMFCDGNGGSLDNSEVGLR